MQSALVRLAAGGFLAVGLLSAHAAVSRAGTVSGVAAANRPPAQTQEDEKRTRPDVESDRVRQRVYYLLARKDCMALSARTRNACLAEARMMWGQ
jgi:hypothetical protein